MHWTVVDGFHTPHLVGGHVALDFCNTWAGWGEPPDPHREWVPDYDRLVTWAVWAGILDRAVGLRLRDRYAGRPEASGIVRQAHALRSTLYGYLTAAPRPAALPDVLLDTIRDARASQVLAPVGSGASWALPRPSSSHCGRSRSLRRTSSWRAASTGSVDVLAMTAAGSSARARIVAGAAWRPAATARRCAPTHVAAARSSHRI